MTKISKEQLYAPSATMAVSVRMEAASGWRALARVNAVATALAPNSIAIAADISEARQDGK
jgi:hypothetical protein